MKTTKYPHLTEKERRRLYHKNFRERMKQDPNYQNDLSLYRRKQLKRDYKKMKRTQPEKFKQYIKAHEQYTKKSRAANINKVVLNAARSRAKKFQLEFTITELDFSIPMMCPIFNIPLIVGKGRAHDNSPSLDRIDSTKGYVPGNVHVISWKANRIKSNATKEELKLLAEYFSN